MVEELNAKLLGWGMVVGGAGMFLAAVFTVATHRSKLARTAEGSAVYDQGRGFREYLETAEASQIKWEEAHEIFSRYLPYAMIFGLAERWTDLFNEVAVAAAAAGQPCLHRTGSPTPTDPPAPIIRH